MIRTTHNIFNGGHILSFPFQPPLKTTCVVPPFPLIKETGLMIVNTTARLTTGS